MDSLSEIVDVVMGVDTHAATHSAAVLDVRTGGVLGEVTVEANPDGYERLVALANEHSGFELGRSRAPGATAPALHAILRRSTSSSSSPTDPNARSAATEPSSIRWTRSVLPASQARHAARTR